MIKFAIALLSGILLLSIQFSPNTKLSSLKIVEDDTVFNHNLEQATLGAGCFWCVEAVFEELNGVTLVEAGYAGGQVENPTYKEVLSGTTGHAEVTRITFDPSVISYDQLLTVFWHTHDPTTLNRQGNDIGPQYRSVIFYHNKNQKEIAERSLKETDQSNLWQDSIVTELKSLSNYSKAENYHQNYYANNPNAGYCQVVIAPKLKKFRKEFSQWLKSN